MWFRRFFPVLMGVIAGLFDATVRVWFPDLFLAIQLTLPMVLLFAVFSTPVRTLMVACAAGVVLDALLPTVGFTTMRLLIVAGVVVAAARLYLTNRSLVGSLALGGVGFFADRLLLWVFLRAHPFFGRMVIPEHRASFFAEGIWVLLCLAVAFFVFTAFTRRFLPFDRRSSG